MTTLKIAKVTALPGSLAADTLYFVKTGASVTSFLTDSSATVAFPLSSENPIHSFLTMGNSNG